jgi:hypothetical protein
MLSLIFGNTNSKFKRAAVMGILIRNCNSLILIYEIIVFKKDKMEKKISSFINDSEGFNLNIEKE